jgi:hypothetical protein
VLGSLSASHLVERRARDGARKRGLRASGDHRDPVRTRAGLCEALANHTIAVPFHGISPDEIQVLEVKRLGE